MELSEIFRKSIFSGQNEDSLSELTKSNLKQFFTRLLDLDKYEKVYCPANRDTLKAIETEIAGGKVKESELEKLAASQKKHYERVSAEQVLKKI